MTKWFSIKVPVIDKPAPCVASTPCPTAPTPCQQATPCQEAPKGTNQQPAEFHNYGASIIGTEDEDMPPKHKAVG